ncbi:hypothetical protein H8L32_17160 [Undibacterium sp. CY18W]|uniref:Replication-associated protein G2P N-terminal domain-containing protein n=1 Tax=Undibacterium hunanense TaxID=2762292 RepID=A0ABR6ZTU3_9BURK|nr:phage/plasmid replication protein [Undibacterium hunanense]MBC3919224.1 hypothetical protein [Undibacterium hunanense]
MIDYFNITVKGNDLPVLGKTVETTHASKVKSKSFTPTKIQVNKHAPSFEVRIEDQGQLIRFSGCPLKLIQCHNGLGINELHPLVSKSIELCFKTLKIKMPSSVRQAIKDRTYFVHEVHIAEYYRIPTASINSFCDNMRRYAPQALGITPIQKGVGIRIWPNSRDRQIIVYDKQYQLQNEVQKHKLCILGELEKKSIDRIGTGIQFDRLIKYLEDSIRIETRFKRGLKSKGLDIGSSWNCETAAAIHRQSLDSVSITDMPSVDALDISLKTLGNQDDRRLLMLWSHGEPLRKVFDAPATYFRFRKRMLTTYGIDVSRIPSPSKNGINWTTLIASKNKLNTPDWAIEDGFIYAPSKQTELDGRTQYEKSWLNSFNHATGR